MERCMSEQRVSTWLHELAAQEVPSTQDLWPAIHAQVQAVHPVQQNRPSPRRRMPSRIGLRRMRIRPLVLVCLVVLVAVGLPVTVIAAQPAVRERLQQRFGLVLVTPTPVIRTPGASHSPAVQAQPTVGAMLRTSLAEAQQQVPFPIRLPTWLPEGVALKGVFVGSGPSADGAQGPVTVTLSC